MQQEARMIRPLKNSGLTINLDEEGHEKALQEVSEGTYALTYWTSKNGNGMVGRYEHPYPKHQRYVEPSMLDKARAALGV